MLRHLAMFVVVVGAGIVAARMIADRGYRLPWQIAPAASGRFLEASTPSTVPPPEDRTLREMAACTAPLTTAEARITACTAALASGGLTQENRAVAICDRGTGYQQTRQMALAAADFDAAVALEPNIVAIHVCRGDAETTRHAYDDAVADFDAAIRLDAGSVAAYAGRGAARLGRREFELAIADETRAIGFDEGNPTPFLDRAEAYRQQKRFALALSDYDRALALVPQAVPALMGRGATRMAMNDCAAALADFDAAIRHDRQDADAYRLRGFCRYRLGRFADALADGEAALKLDPKTEITYLAGSRAGRRPGR